MQMSSTTSSLWQYSAENAISAPALHGTAETDVAVIGGGFTGVSAALHLAEKDAQVTLLEAHTIGHGGSGRNVGLVNPGLWMPPKEVEKKLGEEAGKKLNRILSQGPALVFSLIEKYQINCELTLSGTLHCAHSRLGLANLRERLRQYNARGAGVELLSADATHALTGTSLYKGALLDRRAGTLQPLSYVQGLARAAVDAGATLYQQTPITKLEYQAGKWQLYSPQGQLTANAIVLATNAYHQDIVSSQAPSYTPVNFFQLATKPLTTEMLKKILPQRQGCWDTAMIMSAFRRDQAGRLIVGGVGSLDDSGASIHKRWAYRKVRSLYPWLKDFEFEFAWSGRIAYTANHLPRIVSFGPNAISIFGYSGRGISPGTVFGKAAADFLLSGDQQALPIANISNYRESATGLKQLFFETGATAFHAVDQRLKG